MFYLQFFFNLKIKYNFFINFAVIKKSDFVFNINSFNGLRKLLRIRDRNWLWLKPGPDRPGLNTARPGPAR